MFGTRRKSRDDRAHEQRHLPPSATPFRVSDVLPGNIDSLGRKILEVYAKDSDYAIYLASSMRSEKRIFVQYSDTPAIRDKQKEGIDDLLPLRDNVEYLSDDLRSPIFYQRRLCTGLKLALDGKLDTARSSINALISSASHERDLIGRRIYLQYAVPIALAAGIVLILIGGMLKHGAAHTGSIFLSAGAGAIGALLSIAIAFSDRSVAPDHNIKTNALDGGLRVLIGTISGAAFNLFLSAGFLTGILPTAAHGASPPATVAWGAIPWAAALGLGLVAGFAERFMPDLITRFAAQQGGPAAAVAQSPAAQQPADPAPGSPAQQGGDASGPTEHLPNDHDTDGCRIAPTAAEATPDERLPAAVGGTA